MRAAEILAVSFLDEWTVPGTIIAVVILAIGVAIIDIDVVVTITAMAIVVIIVILAEADVAVEEDLVPGKAHVVCDLLGGPAYIAEGLDADDIVASIVVIKRGQMQLGFLYSS